MFKAGMVEDRGQEGIDKARAALWGPDGFLGALVVLVLSLVLTLSALWV